MDIVIIHRSSTENVVLSGKAWRKFKSSKITRKRLCSKRAYSGGMDPYFNLLLCGDVELNSGPTNHSKNTRSVGRDETPDFSEIILRLEKRIEEGQENIMENQSRVLARLSTIEKEIENFKADIESIKEKQLALEAKVNDMSENIDMKSDNGRDVKFLMDRHEPVFAQKFG